MTTLTPIPLMTGPIDPSLNGINTMIGAINANLLLINTNEAEIEADLGELVGAGGAPGPYLDLTGVASVIAGTIAANTLAGNNRYILSNDAGTNIALPIPTGAGTVLEFVVKTKSLTNGYVLHMTTDSGSNHFRSALLARDTLVPSAVTNVNVTSAGNHNVITLLNGKAGTGGDVWDVIIFTDAIAGQYQVTGLITADTTTATFSSVG